MATPTLAFLGGRPVSAAPLVVFILWAIATCALGVPSVEGLILGMVLGLILGMFLCRDAWARYAEQIMVGMSDRIATITIIAWFWAGMFAQLLREGGLVEGLIWLGGVSGASGGVFVGVTFLLASTFASAVGTGYGTTVSFCTLMYPAGLVLGAEPVWLFAAILSGAAFGDNLAPVSDTTVVSASTQETDIPGVVRSRFRYAILAAFPALVAFTLLGGAGDAVDPGRADAILAESASPEGLVLLVPFLLVIVLALRGHHILVTLTWGILCAIGIGLVLRLLAPEQILSFDPAADAVGGALVEGITGYVPLAVLILLIVAGAHIMRVGGAMEAIVSRLTSFAGESIVRAELSIWSIVFSLNVFITINTAAEIAAAPIVSQLGRRFGLHPYRRANMLDALTSALGYIFPWGGGVLIGYSTLRGLKSSYDFITVVDPTAVWPFVLHGWLLVAVMLLSATTGFGRRFEGPDGEPVRERPAGEAP